jgi:uncharacterized protein YceK
MTLRVLVATVCVLASSGCATFLNVRGIEFPENSRIFRPGRHPEKLIYGGVKVDAQAGLGAIQERYYLAAGYLWLVDLPMSAIADTVTLPITIPATITRGASDRSNEVLRDPEDLIGEIFKRSASNDQ